MVFRVLWIPEMPTSGAVHGGISLSRKCGGEVEEGSYSPPTPPSTVHKLPISQACTHTPLHCFPATLPHGQRDTKVLDFMS